MPDTHRSDSDAPAPAMGAGRVGAPEPGKQHGPSFVRWLVELAALVAIAAVSALMITTYVVKPFAIPSTSMEPTLLIDDRVLVSRSAYRSTEPAAGDVVVFVSPEDSTVDLIKRVVAVGGQTIDIQDGEVFVDGERLDGSFVNREFPDHFDSDAPVTVPPEHVFVMGDNRANSHDSRYFGPVPNSALLGRAFAIYWPIHRIHGL